MNSSLKCVCFLRVLSKCTRLHGGPVSNNRHTIVRLIASSPSGWKSHGSKGKHAGQSDDTNPELKAAAKSVADSLKGESKKTESDILQQLRSHAKISPSQKDGSESSNLEDTPKRSMSDMLTQMRIQKQDTKFAKSFESGGAQRKFPNDYSSIGDSYKLFGGPGLGIFTDPNAETPQKVKFETQKSQSLFDEIEKEEFEKFITSPPRNAFEEMIQWTKEGKLWTFPINNEAGMPNEAHVGFHEHVFLEPLISDFPKKGPIRHFMELVTTGLSKNPYLTVEQKKEHIQWFRDYFKEKQSILEESLGPDGIMSERKDIAK